MKLDSRLLLILLASCFTTAACGQKGPLYLPGRASTFESMTPEQQPAPQQQSEEDDEEQTDNIN